MDSTGFFNNARNTYGQQTVDLLKDWFNCSKKLASMVNRRIFLLQCRMKNVFPNHIINNVNCIYTLQIEENPYKKETDSILKKFRKSILNLEIKITIWKVSKLETKIKFIEEKVKESMEVSVINNFKDRVQNRYNKLFNDIKLDNIKKLNSLQNKYCDVNIRYQSDKIFNFTNVNIPNEVKRILSVGPKFGLPLTKKEIPIPTIVKDIEYCISSLNLNDDKKHLMRLSAINIITNHFSDLDQFNKYDPVISDFNKTKLFLKNNEDIIVAKSDKGNSTILMLKQDYYSHINKMLEDENVYKLLNKDPTAKFQKEANIILKLLFDLEYISDFQLKKMKKLNCIAPKLYGLRKTHKKDVSFRPVVCSLSCPSYEISVLIHNILSSVITTFHFNVKNSIEFVQFINQVKLPDNYELISLDVVSLFTNIPKKLIIDIISSDWRYISSYTNMSKDMFLRLINFIFESSYFKFDNKFYKQLEGTAMGNPASPSLANLVMNFLVNSVLKKVSYHIPFVKIYVDDTSLAIPKNKKKDILLEFNSFHKNLQFTMETEVDGKIPFLDVLLIRNTDNTISTDWYKKPSSSDRILNFLSSHPMHQKINIIKNLTKKCIILSDKKFLDKNVKRIKEILFNNNYPKNLVNRVICETKNKNKQSNSKLIKNTSNEVSYIKYCKFPYISNLSDKLNFLFNKNSDSNCKLVFYNIKTTNTLFSRLKDKTLPSEESNLIYKIDCKNCEKCYIGQTKQFLQKRLKQHEYDCKITNCNKLEKTALALHHFTDNHQFDFKNAKILDKEINFTKRNLSEMIYITLHNNTTNMRSDTLGLSSVYKGILMKYRSLSNLFN